MIKGAAVLEYKILTADTLEQAEQVMNDMARAGWRTVSFTPYPALLNERFAITLEREQ